MTVGSQVISNLQNFSPGKQVPFDMRSRNAVNQLVRRTRHHIMTERVPGIKLNGSEGSMNQLAESLCLVKVLERHNDPADSFHMSLSEHQVVCLGHQFSDGVSFMCLSTQHGACCQLRCQKQEHTDPAFDWCGKEVALVGFGMNSMGARFNPVSVSIVNSESKKGLKSSYEATCSGLYTIYNSASLCDSAECGFCSQMHAQIGGPAGALWRNQLASDDAANLGQPLE